MRPCIPIAFILRCVAAVLFVLFLTTTVCAQITPLGDSYTNSAAPTTNYGAKTLLDVDGATQITYIQFNLGSIPSGATVSEATLKLYVNGVTTAGSFNVDYVNGTWSEGTLDWNNAPALGTTIVSNVPVTTSSKNQYILVNITSAVQAWLNGTEPNDGIALVANGSFNATFDSKENTGTSHPAELDVVFAGGQGTITGVETASGSGLQGGGTSGTLNLSLITSCGSGQVLEWNGSAWACANVGTGTITGVTAGTDLTGGGTSGNVTLNLDTTKVPQLAANNTFTGNQTVNGNLSATGVVSGSSYQIGSSLFAFGSYTNENAFLGFAGNTSMTGDANTASGVRALSSDTTGYANTASGLAALRANTTGANNTASGVQALVSNTTGFNNTATGFNALYSNTVASGNVADGFRALYSNVGDTAGDGQANTAVGFQALYSNNDTSGVGYNAQDNTAVGYDALYSNTTGSYNTASGDSALYSNTTGANNTASGLYALYSNTGGTENTASGTYALVSNTTGLANTASGWGALYSNTTGYDNTAVGAGALSYNNTGNDLTCIGAGCTASENGLKNATAIGAHARFGQSNSLVLGGTGEWAVNVGIGTTKPSNILTIGRGLGHPVSDSWETYSSRRWKTNIHTLHDALGKVEQLRGVSYDVKGSGKHEIGVIAEEVGAVVPEVVSYEKNGKDAAGVDYGRLTALLIEATKEQQALIQQQEEQIRLQQSQINQLTRQVREVQAALKVRGGSKTEVRTVDVNVAQQ